MILTSIPADVKGIISTFCISNTLFISPTLVGMRTFISHKAVWEGFLITTFGFGVPIPVMLMLAENLDFEL